MISTNMRSGGRAAPAREREAPRRLQLTHALLCCAVLSLYVQLTDHYGEGKSVDETTARIHRGRIRKMA